MSAIPRFQISNLAQLEEALENLPANLRTKLKTCDVQESKPLDLFEDDNIFTPGGSYFPDGEKIVDFRARILLLLSNLFPADEAESPSIRLLGQGSYNIVVGVDVTPKRRRGDGSKPSAKISRLLGTPPHPRTFALRIPVEYYFGFEVPLASDSAGDIYQDIANLHVIGQRLELPIPRILKHDLTTLNPLGRPYMLQNYLAGQNLGVIWGKLNLKQKGSAIQAMTQIVEKIASVTAPAAGHIAFSNLTAPNTAVRLNEFFIPPKDQVRKGELPDPCEAMEQTPYEFLNRCCSRWIQHEEKIKFPASVTTPLWFKLIEIISILEEKGWLGDRFHLIHGDLFARNILVEVVSDTAIKVTGVVDWDMARFVPKFVALRGPFWAWNSMQFDESNEDGVNTGAYGVEGKAIKEAFLNAASPEYATMALAEEAIVARKLFTIATEGLLTVKQRDLANQLIRQWNELHPELTKQYVAL